MNPLLVILLKLLLKTYMMRLSSEIEKIELKLPDDYGEDQGEGTLLEPRRRVYPIMEGLWSLHTEMDNLVFAIEETESKDSQE